MGGAGPKFLTHANRLISIDQEISSSFRLLTEGHCQKTVIVDIDHGERSMKIEHLYTITTSPLKCVQNTLYHIYKT